MDTIDIKYCAGKVRGMEVVAVVKDNDDRQIQVQLLGSFEGISDVGEPFIGKGALRRASVFSESILATLEIADISWDR